MSASQSQEGGCAVESLGARLRQQRERQKMTLDEVASTTKIGTRMLKALEEEHFDQLPGGIFNKGFVRAYARHLGMDEDQAVADYLAANGATQPIKEPEAVLNALATRADEARSTRQPGDGLPWDKLAAVLLLIAFGFAVWGWRNREQVHAGHAAAAPVASAPAAKAAPAPAQSNAAGVTDSTAPVASMSPPAPTAALPSASDHTFVVLIQAHDDSWLEVTADGKDIEHELLTAGAQKTVQAEREIVVKAGNIGGLDFSFNGTKLPPQGPSDEVKTLKFDPSGLEGAEHPATGTPNPA